MEDAKQIHNEILESETDFIGYLNNMYKEFTNMSMRPFCNNACFERCLEQLNDLARKLLLELDFDHICSFGDIKTPVKPNMEFMKETRQNNCMDVLEKFVLKKNKENTVASFFTMYGYAKRSENSKDYDRLEPLKHVGQFLKSGYSNFEISKISNFENEKMNYPDNMHQDLFSGEKGYDEIKKVAINRLRGRALLEACKSGVPNCSKYFLRWMVRSHTRHGARCIEYLVLKSKIS